VQSLQCVSPCSILECTVPVCSLPRIMPHRRGNFSRISSSAEAIRRRQEHEARELAASDSNAPRIRLGVCSMDKKAQSKPMLAILKRMNTADEFEIVFFGDEVRPLAS
jgi:hypothetical protein